MGEYERTKAQIRASFGSPKWRGPWALFFDSLQGASCMSVGASRTGNQTLLRVRVGKKRHELRLETRDLRGTRGAEHVVGELLKKFIPCDKNELIAAVEMPGESLWVMNMGFAFSDPVRAEALNRGVRFLEDAVSFVFSQNVGARQDAYQLDGAMGEFKNAVKAALQKGAAFSDMETVLKEMAVLSVMES